MWLLIEGLTSQIITSGSDKPITSTIVSQSLTPCTSSLSNTLPSSHNVPSVSNCSFKKMHQEIIQKLDKMTKANEDCFKSMNTEILNLREEVKVMKKILKGSYMSSDSSHIAESKLPTLPVKTVEELDKLEELLKNSEEERKNFVTKLSVIGGSSARSVVNAVMNAAIARNVAMQFSMHGKGEKKTFKELQIFSCMIGKGSSV